MYINATEKDSQGSIREFDTLTLQQGSSEESPIDTTLVLSLRFCNPHHTSSSPAQDRRGGKESDPGRTDSESSYKSFSWIDYQPPPPRLVNHAAMTKLERSDTDREEAPDAGAVDRQSASNRTWTFEVSRVIKQAKGQSRSGCLCCVRFRTPVNLAAPGRAKLPWSKSTILMLILDHSTAFHWQTVQGFFHQSTTESEPASQKHSSPSCPQQDPFGLIDASADRWQKFQSKIQGKSQDSASLRYGFRLWI